MRGSQRLARGLRERQAQRGLGGRSGVGKPRERRRRTGQVAELLAGGQSQGGGLHQRDPAGGLFARGEAAFVRVQPAGQLGLHRPAGALQSGDPRLQRPEVGGCRCSRAAMRLSSGARSGAAAGAPPCGGGRCSRAATRAPSGARSELAAADAVPAGPPGFQRIELARQGIGRFGGRRRNGGVPPDPDQCGRQDQEAGGGQPGKRAPPRRGAGRRRGRLDVAGPAARSVGSLIGAARASRPGSAERRHGSAARGAPVMPRRRAGR